MFDNHSINLVLNLDLNYFFLSLLLSITDANGSPLIILSFGYFAYGCYFCYPCYYGCCGCYKLSNLNIIS